jgi:hypothetical protein
MKKKMKRLFFIVLFSSILVTSIKIFSNEPSKDICNADGTWICYQSDICLPPFYGRACDIAKPDPWNGLMCGVHYNCGDY